MSSRLTRKDIKRDEVLETLGGFVGFVNAHGRTILLGVAGLVVVALGVAGYRAFEASRAAKASAALAEALDVYTPGAEAEDPDAAASRRARATPLFAAVAEGFAGTAAADVADAYLGSIAAAEGDLEGAREHWRRFVERQKEHLLALEVRLNLMTVERALGRGEEMVDELRAELSSARPDLPEEILLNQLGLTLESLGRDAEAADIYRRLVQDFPQSPYSGAAGERLAALEAAAGEA